MRKSLVNDVVLVHIIMPEWLTNGLLASDISEEITGIIISDR